MVGYLLGSLIGKVFGMSGPSTQALSNALAAGLGTAAAGAAIVDAVPVLASWGPIGWVILIIAAVVAVVISRKIKG